MDEGEIDRLYESFLVHGDFERSIAVVCGILGAKAGSVQLIGPQSDTTISTYIDKTDRSDANWDWKDWERKAQPRPPKPILGEILLSSVQSDGLGNYSALPQTNAGSQTVSRDILAFAVKVSGDTLFFTLYRFGPPHFSQDDVVCAQHLQRHIIRILRLRAIRTAAKNHLSTEVSIELTESEARIVKLLHRGLSQSDVCRRLSISRNTLKWHLRNIFQKFDVNSVAQLLVRTR